MGAKERLEKLVEVQNKDYEGVLEFLTFCEADLKNEPKQEKVKQEKIEQKPITQDEYYWKLIDKRLAKNGIRI